MGGAVVASVLPDGPANGILWQGDLLLSIDGRPVYGDSPESFALALFPLTPSVPAEVVVWRGGRPQRFSVVARRARALDPAFQRRHDALGAG